MSNPTASAIIWPSRFLPGTTDNFVSNEVIAKDLRAADIWPLLADITQWSSYYDNVSQITPPKSGNIFQMGNEFSFSTFGLPPLVSSCEESVTPNGAKGVPGRLAWRAWLGGSEDEKLDVYHAWIVEDVEGGRVRILTQESQFGKSAADMAGKKPNPMLNGHQNWLDGLVKKAREKGKA